MYTYFSTFISGFSGLIEKALKGSVAMPTITLMLDGLVVYKTETPPEKIRNVPFFNNSYYLLDKTKGTQPTVPKEVVTKAKTFRVITSKENAHIALQKQQLEKREMQFAKILNLKVDRAN